jgi:hypothetical protein
MEQKFLEIRRVEKVTRIKSENMGEEVTQLVNSSIREKYVSIDEIDRAIHVTNSPDKSCEVSEKCEDISTQTAAIAASCDETISDPELIDKSTKKVAQIVNVNSANHKPHDGSIEKAKKWYNISFIHRTANNLRNSHSSENKSSDKMDKRHSWHLNDSAVVEM